MLALLYRADQLLRGGRWVMPGEKPLRTQASLVLVAVVFGVFYGAVMGTQGGFRGDRPLQVVYSALKVPLLLLVTFVVSLPSFFVLNTLAGLRDDFGQATRALAATQAGLTIILASLAPFTAVWYASTPSYNAALLFNALMFGLASLSAQWILARLYRPLIQRDVRHRWLLRVWLIIYAFVGMQMGYLLRPFIGEPNISVTFVRSHPWGNAYEVILHVVLTALGFK